MLKDTSKLTLDNLEEGDIVGLFISGIGEVICKIKEVTSTDVHVSNPYRFILQEQGIGLAPVGNLAAIAEQQDGEAPSLPFNRSQVVYIIPVPQEISDSYSQQTSGIEIAHGNVDNIVNTAQK